MRYAEVITEVQQLTLAERVMLVETILRWWREELTRAEAHERLQSRQARLQTIPPASALRGIAKTSGPTPTDSEIQDEHIAHLEKKYTGCVRSLIPTSCLT
jgi:hypothetical protein